MHSKTRPVLAALALLAGGLTTACGGSSVDASCDVDGVTHEVEHILSEANAELAGLASLSCADGWALADATVSGDAGETREIFLLRSTGDGWILTSVEEACSPGSPFAVADALRDQTCQA